MGSDESVYHSYLLGIEGEFKTYIKNTYPLFRELNIDWNFKEKLPANTFIIIDSSIEKGISIQLNKKPKKLNKVINKVSKYFKLNSEELTNSFYLFHLFMSFYKMIEAPYSKKDRKKLHSSMFQGIKIANPDFYEYESIQCLEYLHLLVKEFITLNRLVNENEENSWFQNEVIILNYYLVLEKALATVNSITILWYINTNLYCKEKALHLIEDKFMDEVFTVANRTIKRTLNKRENVNLPNRLNDYFSENKKLKREKNIYKKLLQTQFQGIDRYEGVKRLVEVISPYIAYEFIVTNYVSTLSKNSIYYDLFETFSLQDQALFVKSIIDESKLLKNGSIDVGTPIEIQLIHEFYKKNRPTLVLLGDEGFNQNLYKKGNYRVKLNKINFYSSYEVNKLDLAKIYDFQNNYGVPVLIPVTKDDFYYYEYEIKYEERRKMRYRKISRFFTLPDVLEIYLDNTGSMFFEEDNNHLGFNDGSRRDISISVVYAFIMELYSASRKQNKKCLLRIHSFSEKQVSTDLAPIEDFVQGNEEILKVLYQPENGYNFENLDIMDEEKLKNSRRVIIIITDGDLVLEGRTEREALKMKQLARDSNTQVILFEMEQQFSLGKAVNSDPLILQHSVKNKDLMFKKGIEVILAHTSN